MTPQLVFIALVRITGSLPVLRWPLAGGILAVLVDLSDLFLMDTLGGVPNYQLFDKLADQFYLAMFLLVALRWRGVERNVSIVLYAFRLVGFVLFEATGERAILLAFPNVFEFWFLFVAALHHVRPSLRWSAPGLAAAFVPLLGLKELQEWALHWARLFDGFTALEAIDAMRRWLLGLLGIPG